MAKKTAKKSLFFILFPVLAVISLILIGLWVVKMFEVLPENNLNDNNNVNVLKQSDDIDYDKLAVGAVDFRLDQILEAPGARPDLDMMETRMFDIYLERPDLKLKQPEQKDDSLYASALPAGLRPVRVFVSDPDDRGRDSGNFCEVAVFPHRCTLNLSANEQGKSKIVLIKVVFADRTYAEKELTIPFAGMLAEPVILEPKSAPQNGEAVHLKFNDVGASEYKIGMHICRKYGNDGINPCLKGMTNTLVKKGNGFIAQKTGDATFETAVKIKVENGTVDVTFPSKYNFDVTDISTSYSVIATLQGATEAGVKTYLTVDSDLELNR
jgi:hypothetical protein